jgi:hypothetical protein
MKEFRGPTDMKHTSEKPQKPKHVIEDALSREGIDFIISKDGVLTALADTCMITFVNCRTKEPETVTLKKGEVFYYGDWDGTQCVRKTFEC